MKKLIKLLRKVLKEQIPSVRDLRHRIQIIKEIIRTFQNIECYVEIQLKRRSGRRYFANF